MPYSAPMSYETEDQDAIPTRWIVLFVILSLFAHAMLIVGIIFLSKHIPAPKLEPTTTSPTVTLQLIQPPPPTIAPKHIFMPTPEQKNAVHKETLVESDHDTQVASQSKAARKPDTVMPDVVSKSTHSSSLDSSPSAPPAKQQAATTPPTPKADPAKQQPTPPQPQQPPQPKADPSKTPPTKTPPPPKPTPTPSKVPPPPTVDENGLPVLPSLSAPTMAPPLSATAQAAQQAAPPPMMPIVPMDMQGRAGMSGQPSPEAMKTDLGQYKARFYQAVGSRWYQKVGQHMQLIGVGSVRVEYTITPDGIVSYRVLESGGGNMQILLTYSVSSIRDTSPFLPFPPSMIKEYPNGYTDDFSFSIY